MREKWNACDTEVESGAIWGMKETRKSREEDKREVREGSDNKCVRVRACTD